MPLNDVVSPVIQAFLAGQKQKLDRERNARDAQADEDTSKLRQQQAQQIAKEIKAFDGREDARLTAQHLANNINIHKGILDGSIPVKKIREQMAAIEGSGSGPMDTGGIGISDIVKTYASVGGKDREVQSPDAMLNQQAVNQQTMDQAKLPGLRAQADIGLGNQIKIQDRQFAQQNAAREDTQANQAEILDKTQGFTFGQNEATRANNEKIAKWRVTAQASEARLRENHQTRLNQARIDAADGRQQKTIALKNLVDEADVDDFVETNVRKNLGTHESIKLQGLAVARRIEQKSTALGLKIPWNKERETLTELNTFNEVLEEMKAVSQNVGDGAAIRSSLGNWNELGKLIESLNKRRPFLAKMLGVKGAQSDKDSALMGGSLAVTRGEGTAKENQQRYKTMQLLQASVFRKFYPKGTDRVQLMNAAEMYGVSKEALAIYEEEQDALNVPKEGRGKK